MNFGENVKKMREAINVSQEALSEKSGVSRQMISHIECGRKAATIYVAVEIAHALGCSLDELTKENCA